MDKVIRHDGDTWRVLALGVERDGKTYAHLASLTRGRTQRNGFVPAQFGDFIDNALLQEDETV